MKYMLYILMSLLLCSCDRETGLYVAPDGNDSNPGTRAKPFRTVEKARDTIRALRSKRNVDTPITVFLREGEYVINNLIEFSSADSGTPQSPVVYRAFHGEPVVLTGSKVLNAAAFGKTSNPEILACARPEAQDNLVELDLARHGVQHTARWPDLINEGELDLFELYFNGVRLPLAQYPNKGFMHMKEVIEVGSKAGQAGIFKYADERHEKWAHAVKRGLWFKGFWRVPWQSEYVLVSKIDFDEQLVYQAQYVNGGIGSKYHRPHGSGEEPYIAVNLIEEIDSPGEWCIDYGSGKLYLWPPSDIATAHMRLSDSSAPLIKFNEAKYLTLNELLIEGRLGNAIEVDGGSNITISQCTIRNIGKDAVVLNKGFNHCVQGCEIYDVGAQGIFAAGGDRAHLISAGHLIADNHIYRFARTKTIYAAGINLGYGSSYGENPDCVGIIVRNNLIHDTPHVGVLYGGNNNLLEYNEIHTVAQVSNDMGGFYTVNDWTSRGNVLRYNFVHSSPHAEGIYCDDGDSGDQIYCNAFYNLHTGVFIGGGHDNIVVSNIAVRCERGFHVDARGVPRKYNLTNRRMVERVTSVNPQSPPWSIAYPAMANILDATPELPTGTVFLDNLAINCKQSVNVSGDKKHFEYCIFDGNQERAIDGLSSVEELREFLKVCTKVPIDKIGLRRK